MVRLIELIDRDAGGQEGGFRYLIGRFLSACIANKPNKLVLHMVYLPECILRPVSTIQY